MGVDFLRSKAKAFKKRWDMDRLELARRNLFTRDPECTVRTIIGRTFGSVQVVEGTRLLLRAEGEKLTGLLDLVACVDVPSPPESIMQAVRESGGYANGVVALAMPSEGVVEVLVQ